MLEELFLIQQNGQQQLRLQSAKPMSILLLIVLQSILIELEYLILIGCQQIIWGSQIKSSVTKEVEELENYIQLKFLVQRVSLGLD